jgi:hypothetical protein
MYRVGLVLLLGSLGCKKLPTDALDGPGPGQSVTLPPGEEMFPLPTNDPEAEAKAAPLTPPPGVHLVGADGPPDGPQALRQFEMSARFARGETVDMDGNGRPDHYGRWVGGKFTYTIDTNEDGKPDEVSDGETVKSDFDFDGKWDEIETNTRRPSNNGPKMVRETDSDHDGVMDERYTIEYLAPLKRVQRVEKRNAQGAWEVTEEWTDDGIDSARSSEVMTDIERRACHAELRFRFPADLGPPFYSTPYQRHGSRGVTVPYGGTDPRRCSPEDAAKVATALACVVRKLRGCLWPLNPELAKKMEDYVVRARGDTRAYVSCNGACEGEILAAYRFPHSNGTTIAAIELSPQILARPDKAICEGLFHELMHAAGIKGVRDHDSPETTGTDQVYSCARVCSGCSHWSLGAGNDHLDCARCGSDVGRKQICGLKPVVLEDRVPDEPPSCWRVRTGRFETASGERHQVETHTCDDLATAIAPSHCIAGCPEGFGLGTINGWCSDLANGPGNGCKAELPLRLCDI